MKRNQVCTSPSTYSNMTEALTINRSHDFTPMLLTTRILTRDSALTLDSQTTTGEKITRLT